MKKTIILLGLLLLAIPMTAQTAHWITAVDTLRNEPNTWMEFRKDFTLKKKPREAVARIAADSKYWLWVNDSLAVFEGSLKRGPNRTDTYFDAIDLAPWLKKGRNDVRLLLCYFGKPGFSHVSSGQSGVIVDAPAIGLVTDSTWQNCRLLEYQTCDKPYANFRLAESNIRYDARLQGRATLKPSLEIGTWGEGAWGKLVERPIPQWKDYGLTTTEAGQWTVNSKNGMTVYSLRLPYNMQMTPYIELTDEQGGTTVKLQTDHVRGGKQDDIRAEYVTRKGRQHYESLGWMNGDRLDIIVPADAPVTLHRIGYRETGYDCEREGRFSCPDDFVMRFWEKAMRTLYVNMRDNYFDCPDRERAQWWGDATILMGQSFCQLSPRANALMRKAIRELADWQRDDGVLFSPIPAQNWSKELPAQSLTAIGTQGFWQYYMHTGDSATLRYVYPAVRRYLSLWSLDDDGLTVYRKGDWDWTDWGHDHDDRLLMAAWHYMALDAAIRMARLSGCDADIPGYEQQMSRLHEGFNKCWNGYAYRHPSYQDATDDRTQALAVVSGLADSTRYEAITTLLHSQQYASPYMEKYVMEALCQMGHADYALERMKKKYATMVDDTLHSTLFEAWEEGTYGGGSTNHAWSGGPLTVIAQYVCGIQPTAPGYQRFRIAPDPSALKEADITVPTVRGPIRSAYRLHSDGQFTLDVTVPKGTESQVVLPAGAADVTLNGKPTTSSPLTVKAGVWHISAK